MIKKIALSVATVLAAFTFAGCESFTYEAEPVGGLDQDPDQIECFHVEADSSAGDDGDVQLGEFCKDGAP